MIIRYSAARPPEPAGLLFPDGRGHVTTDLWSRASLAKINHFHKQSSDHRPVTVARLMHDEHSLLLHFDVQDRYVLATATEFQQLVCVDSCVEFFFRPRASAGYFNVEINCIGTLLMSYIEDPRRTETAFAKWTPVRWEDACRVQIQHTLPHAAFSERPDALAWQISCRIPLIALEPYTGPLGPLGGQTWSGNFYKCADHSSHPHWGSWSPIGEALNFHAPERFGIIQFE